MSTFSSVAKDQIKRLNVGGGQGCWHCGATPADICHVIGKKDNEVSRRLHGSAQPSKSTTAFFQTPKQAREAAQDEIAADFMGYIQFPNYLAKGILNFSHLGHIENGIPLCPLCHRNFDDLMNPGFIFIPTDIEYFADFERKDMERRRALWKQSKYKTKMGRICPSPNNYRLHQLNEGILPDGACGGLYYRYTLRDYFPRLGQPAFVPGRGPFPTVGAKPWHGAPTAALRRAFPVLGHLLAQGIPGEVREALWGLQKLYLQEIEDGEEMSLPAGDTSGDEEMEAAADADNPTGGASDGATQGGIRDDREEQDAIREMDERDIGTQPHEDDEGRSTSNEDSSIRAWLEHTISEELLFEEESVHTHSEEPRTPDVRELEDLIQGGPERKKQAVETTQQQERWKWGPFATSADVVDFFSHVL